MAKTREQKKAVLDSYKEQIANSKSVIILRTNGVTPSEATGLRKNLFDFDSGFNVVKNTLFKIALEESGLEVESSLENLEHSVVFIKEDIVGSSKVLKEFINDTKTKNGDSKVSVVSGFLDGNKLSSAQVEELADMPSIQGSISMILGILDQAIAGVANVLNNPVQSYVNIIDQAFKE